MQARLIDGLTITDIEGGFPHSEIRGSKLVRSSPRLIAAYHVLHRLSAPRHPPDTLKTLDRSHYQRPSLGSDRLRSLADPDAALIEKTSFASSTSENAAVRQALTTENARTDRRALSSSRNPLIGYASSSRCQIDRPKRTCARDETLILRTAVSATP
jgi:hypothetical protein